MATSLSQPLTPAALDLQQLPDDPPTLKGMILELVQALQQQQRHADHLQTRLDQLLRRLYGRRSERLDPSQLLLFAHGPEADAVAAVAADKQVPDDTSGSRRPRRPGAHGRQHLPDDLPRHVIRHELTEAERNCPCCGQQRTVLGEEVSEQLEYVPASVLVNQHVRVTYVCYPCQRQRPQPSVQGDTTITTSTCATPLPASDTVAVVVSGKATPVAEQVASGLAPEAQPDVARSETNVAATPGTGSGELPHLPVARPSSTPATTVTPVACPLPLPATIVPALSTVAGTTPVSSPAAAADAVPATSNVGRVFAPGSCSTFITAPMPPQPIPKCLAGPGLLAHIIVNKFVDHLPLYRQEQQFLREGVWLSRRTLCDWLAGCARVLQPLFAHMWQRVFQSHDLHTDDTSVRVQGQNGKGHLWVYVGNSAHPYIVYDFTLGRGEERPLACLSAFRGYLHADAYGVYDKTFGTERIEVGCWAHARRYFYDARDTDPVRACYVLSTIGRLYTLEAAAKYAWEAARLSEREYWDVRQQLREREARPLLASLSEYLVREQPGVLPRSPIGEAFTYLSNQWLALQQYLSHGFLDIDNNVAEQALRAIALGRKNWLFLGSEEGGRTAATLYSLVQTCKRHGVDPWFYLRAVLTILPTLTESTRSTELPKLLPDEWARSQRQQNRATPPCVELE
jgi:transposase